LFLGEADRQIVVLAVRKNSPSQQLGIHAGATLTAINGKPLAGLADFRDRYYQEKQAVEEQGRPLTMTFILTGETVPKELAYRVPRSLNSNLLMMGLPDADVKPSPSETAPATAP
jgi:S1-C subfamily serine protease